MFSPVSEIGTGCIFFFFCQTLLAYVSASDIIRRWFGFGPDIVTSSLGTSDGNREGYQTYGETARWVLHKENLCIE